MRLTYLKITGGDLKVKTILDGEKIDQIRIYSGSKYELVQEVSAGDICTVTGLTKTHPVRGLAQSRSRFFLFWSLFSIIRSYFLRDVMFMRC